MIVENKDVCIKFLLITPSITLSNSLTFPYCNSLQGGAKRMITIHLLSLLPLDMLMSRKIAKSRNDGPEVKAVNDKKVAKMKNHSLSNIKLIMHYYG